MDLEQLHPELRAVYKRIPSVPLHNRLLLGLVQGLQKLRSPAPLPAEGVTISDYPLSQRRVRVYRPTDGATGGAMLWIHGGGYIIGDPSINDRECIRYARELGLTVVSAGYRLAPAHPFPAASDDCLEAWYWLQDRAGELGVDPARTVIIGQSAGGGLAAGLVQRIADEGGVQPACQALIYPMIDDRTACRPELDALKHRLWNNKNNRGAWRHYLKQSPGLASVPAYAAPARRDDLSGLPDTWIGVGERDLFYDEDCRYAERLKAAGVSCELHVIPQAPHGFDLLVPEASISRDMNRDLDRFLHLQLGL